MEHAIDGEGRLFIDRDPDLFASLLQFMRAHTGPPQSYLKNHKEALLEECRFFGLHHMEDRLRGLTSDYDLRPEDRRLKVEETDMLNNTPEGWQKNFLLDVFAEDLTPIAATTVGVPLLRNTANTRPLMRCHGFEHFKARLQALSGDTFNAIEKIEGIAFAGGSVMGALTGTAVSDIDIFLTASPEQAPAILEKIYEAVRTQDVDKGRSGRKLLITRSKHAVQHHHLE